MSAHGQAAARVRFDGGLPGAVAVAQDVDVAVVVDVLSFTTTLTVALDAGVTVLPYRWGDRGSAEQYARQHDALLAVGRFQAAAAQVSLSPWSIRHAAEPPARLVLPSPNGSTIAYELAASATTCLGACLRNASAVAAWIANQYHLRQATVALIAAGERWDDGSLRLAVEDMWGAGAVIAGLQEGGWGDLSPEADAARAAYQATSGHEHDALRSCASGQELIRAGFATDVAIAAETDHSSTVPRLIDGYFRPG